MRQEGVIVAKRQRECVYCGAKGELTKDHIPPKSLFSKPRPANLITVPSCGRCNNAASKDDEYFKAVLSLKERVGNHPDAKGILESVLHSLARREGRSFSVYFLNKISHVNVRTPAAVYLGKRLSYDVDLKRFGYVAARIVRGLFYVLKGKRIPSEYMVVAFCEDGLRDLPESDQEALRQTIVIPVLSGTPGSVANNVMRYSVSFEPRQNTCQYGFWSSTQM
jgi:hypothetical protein